MIGFTQKKLIRSNTEDSPFYQSLTILGNSAPLMRLDRVRSDVDYLMVMQTEDESLKSHQMLQFPLPKNINPGTDQRKCLIDLSSILNEQIREEIAYENK